MMSMQGVTGPDRPLEVHSHCTGRARRADGTRRQGRLRWTAVLVAAGGMALAACGSSAPSASKSASSAQVTTVSLWESHNGGPVGDAVSALVAKFNASHPSVQVDVTVTKASKKLLAATAAGDPPVLAEISHYMQTFEANWRKLTSAVLLALAPIVIVFLALQRHIVNGVAGRDSGVNR